MHLCMYAPMPLHCLQIHLLLERRNNGWNREEDVADVSVVLCDEE